MMVHRVLIFCWHNVCPTEFFASEGTEAVDGFRRQMRFLRRVTTPVSLPEAVTRLAEGRPLPRRASVVTFDDGYRDNLHVAAPVLREEGIPATFFLVPDFLSNGEAPWWERLAWALRAARPAPGARWMDIPLEPPAARGTAPILDVLAARLKTFDEVTRQQSVKDLIDLLDPAGGEPRTPMMDWDEAAVLADMGFTIGSHSSRHAILANEDFETQLDDLRQARAALERRTGRAVDVLAYPNGGEADFGQATLQAARRAGYRGAVTTIDGWNDAYTELLALHRFVMYPEWGIRGFGVVGRHLARSVQRRSGLRRHRR